MTLTVEVPEEVALALRLPPSEVPAELRKELALSLYARRLLPAGKARQLAGLDKWAFDELLGRRGVVREYTSEDLAVDVDYAGGRQ